MPTDTARLHAVFDLAMRIGEGLLSNGAAASEVTATVLRVTSSSGLRNVSVQVTFDEVTISYLPDRLSAPFTRVRSTGTRDQDFSRLAAFEDVTHRYISGELDLEEARRLAEEIPREKPAYPLSLVTAGFAVMGGAAALSLGAGALVTVAATVAAGVLILIGDVLTKQRIPQFYSQAVGGMVGVLIAVLVDLIDPTVNSSIVVVACIIVQLAGLTSFGAMQDAVTGWFVTASGRILETLMLTVGVVAGVRGGLLIADMLGADISVSAQMPVSLISVLVLVVSGAGMGLGYGVGTQIPMRVLAWASAVAVGSAVTSHVLSGLVLDRVYATSLTAFLVGAVSVLLSDRLRAPSLAFVMAGVIPMVPGSRIFRGLLGLGSDVAEGAVELLGAAEVAVAIAAGAILGQLVLSRLLARLPRGRIAYAPVISTPFTTLRRRRMSLGLRRSRRKGRTAHVEPSTMTGEMTALSPTLLEELEATSVRRTDHEETS